MNEIHDYLCKLKSVIDILSLEEINSVMLALEKARQEGRTIFVMGTEVHRLRLRIMFVILIRESL